MADNGRLERTERQRTINADAIGRRLEEVRNAELVQAMPAPALFEREQELGRNFEAFKVAHKYMVRAMHADDLEEAADYLEHVSQQYFEAMGVITSAKLDKIVVAQPEALDSASVLGGGVIRVETARQPEPGEFDGRPANWPAFRDRFKAEVHDRPQLDNVTKLIYLQKACIRSAKYVLGDWQPTAANYEKAWASLEHKFEDGHRLKQALIAKLIRLPLAQEESYNDLRKIIDGVSNTLRQLEAMKAPVAAWDDLVIGLIIDRLPKATKDAWEQKRDIRIEPTLANLMDFLEAKARGRGHMEEDSPSERGRKPWQMSRSMPPHMSNGQVPKTWPRTNFTPFNGNSEQAVRPPIGDRRPPCQVCNETVHPLYYCQKFLAKPRAGRLDDVNRLELCHNCFLKHTGVCQRPGCPKCAGEKHNSVICPKLIVPSVITNVTRVQKRYNRRSTPYQS